MAINKKQIKQFLEAHEFGELFNQLGWDWPESDTPYPVQLGEELFKLHPVALKRGFIAYHCPCVPDSATRAKIETRLSHDVREHIIIFTDEETKKQRWQWVRRVPGQPLSRKEHEYQPNQPMLLIEKLYGLEIPMSEEEEIDLIGVLERVRSSLDIDKVTKKFYDRFKKEHDAFLGFIDGITDMGDARWYASVMLNRLMFIYFIQKKGFLDGDTDYLRNRLKKVQEIKGTGKFHTFYRYFLKKLCHEVLAKKDRSLDSDLAKLIGNVPYLNGGIFQPHELELKYSEGIDIPDEAFQEIFDFFDGYEWHLDNRPAANANEINPDVLGYIFEKYINQKQMGAYYTKEDITEYIGKNTIIPCLFDKAQKSCKIAFEGEASVWNLLQTDPDRYIYPAVRHGVTYDVHNDVELAEPVPYPEEIAVGLDTSKPDLLERRKKWNTPAPPEAGLPTEIWRETVARRLRYEEVKGKLQRGEVRSINDLITLNLDIRQFAQDVIERCESPDLLNAFWTAIAGYVPKSGNNKNAVAPLTVLDPTCGSGAFLFAALNILEPLYEACLERMKGFLEEWGCTAGVPPAASSRASGFQPASSPDTATVPVAKAGGTPAIHAHPNYARFFQSIRDDIGRHPSPKYFIYKSIIIHNLYGVDIMKEAVEICKLRLFLKLVAQVDDGAKIEPLPDIDFNIRAGNTLVGFATQEEMKRALQGDLLAYQTVLPEILEQAEECDRLFNLFREAQLEGDKSLPKAKKTLQAKLAELNEQLNQYLAADYGVDPSKPKKFDAFLETHQPFHWFIEFYGIIKTGGFDTIIGNPPYVEYSKVRKEYQIKGYGTEQSGNLYAFMTERSLQLLRAKGGFGFIVPISVVCTQRMQIVQEQLSTFSKSTWVSDYAERPGKLFEGAEVLLTIVIAQGSGNSTPTLFSSGFTKWSAEERPYLFARQTYCEVIQKPKPYAIPKLTVPLETILLEKMLSQNILAHQFQKNSKHRVFYRIGGGRYWKIFTNFQPRFVLNGQPSVSSRESHLYFSSEALCDAAISVLSSSVFYWYFVMTTNCRDLNPSDLKEFPINLEALVESKQAAIQQLCGELMKDYASKGQLKEKTSKKTGEIIYQEFYPRLSKPLIDEIDKVLAEHYGFTDEELDYIINYDIKYRMGKDLQEDGSDD